MNLSNYFFSTLFNENISTAIFSTLFIMLLGFIFKRKSLFDEKTDNVMTYIVLSVSLPALAFNSFMADIDLETLRNGFTIFLWGMAVYPVLILFSELLFYKYEKDKKTILKVMTLLGSTTFFGIPIVTAVYGEKGTLYALLFNIGYRIWLYTYGYLKVSDTKLRLTNIGKIVFNPILLATLLGLLIWILQEYLFIMEFNTVSSETGILTQNYSLLRIDRSIPQLYHSLKMLGQLATPLSWLAIGSTLGDVNIKETMFEINAWYYTVVKVIIVPLINITFLYILNLVGLNVDFIGLSTVVIMMATPAATVVVSYAISFDKEKKLASESLLISTLVSILFTPIWILLLTYLQSFNIF